jgi:hypothetical protein
VAALSCGIGCRSLGGFVTIRTTRRRYRRMRRNPSGNNLLLWGAIALGAYLLWRWWQNQQAGTAQAAGGGISISVNPTATPPPQQASSAWGLQPTIPSVAAPASVSSVIPGASVPSGLLPGNEASMGQPVTSSGLAVPNQAAVQSAQNIIAAAGGPAAIAAAPLSPGQAAMWAMIQAQAQGKPGT